MTKKIAIIGTHSTGKTTLSYMLAAHYKKQGKNVKIIQEVARSCPYPLNENMTQEACLWIYHEHMKKELEAIQKFDTVICDRSAFDSFIYAETTKCLDFESYYMNYSRNAASEWMLTYDKIIYITPESKNPVDDGVRSVDKSFQISVNEIFHYEVIKLQVNMLDKSKIFVTNSDAILNQEKWNESFKQFIK